MLVLCTNYTMAQSCDPTTPSFNANLSASPTMSWTSPSVSRNGNCCGTTAPNKCIEFFITLHPNATAINFQISSGAVPPGALFYQINCGPPIAVGTPICLNGAGPHHLTFCKPGNNINTFTITSYSLPTFGPDLILSNGCSGMLTANYYNEASITWNSINPGTIGQYNTGLSCIGGCDTTIFTSNIGFPNTMQYEVCGYDANGCIVNPICHIFTVTNIPAPTTNLPFDTVMICPGDSTIWINANVNSSNNPYNISWSNGAQTDSALLSAGWNYVTISDTGGCSNLVDSIFIQQNLAQAQANAGPDQVVCQISTVNLSATMSNGQNPNWWGGTGNYSNPMSTNSSYTPSAADLSYGSVTLFFSINGMGSCPGDSDTLTILLPIINPNIAVSTTNITCNGDQNGTATVTNLNTTWAPFAFSLDNGASTTTSAFNNLTFGIHQILVTNAQGCDTLLYFNIVEPAPIVAGIDSINHVSCYGFSDGNLSAFAIGGTPNYTYSWSPIGGANPVLQNIPAGVYTCTITDGNGCIGSISATITEPPLLIANTLYGPIPCYGDSTLVNTNVAGGTPPYTYSWSNQANTSSAMLTAGTHNIYIADANNCSTNLNFTLTQPAPLHLELPSDMIVCANSPIILNAITSGGTIGYSYLWSQDPMINTASTYYTPNNPGYVSVTVNDQNNCSFTDSVLVDLYTSDLTEFNLSSDSTSICAGDSKKVDYIYTGITPVTSVIWLDNANIGFPRYFQPLVSTYYVAQLTTICGDILSDTVYIHVYEPPTETIQLDKTKICPGESVTFNFDAGNQNNWNYSWVFSNGQYSTSSSPTIIFNTPGNQTVQLTVINPAGCPFIIPALSNLWVHNHVIADFTSLKYTTSIFDPTIHLTNTSVNAATYLWNFSDGNTSTLTNPSHTYDVANDYLVTLYATSTDGCLDVISKIFTIEQDHTIYVPNAFTHDGNKTNNFFSIKGFNLSEERFLVMIFDRWGHEVFTSNDLHFEWDGNINGTSNEAVQGTYTWKIIYEDMDERRNQIFGHVMLLR